MNKETYLKKIVQFLKDSTHSRYVYITKRCNSAILYSLRSMKKLGRFTVLIPEQGGWLTYKQYPPRLKMHMEMVKTDSSKLDLDDLESKLMQYSGEAVFIFSSLAGYFVEHDVSKIYSLCKKYDVVLINDVSGSLGTTQSDARECDILVCSFGEWKPVNFGDGGFISFNDKKYLYEELEHYDMDYQGVYKNLKELEARNNFLYKKSDEIKNKFSDFDIIHKDSKSINVLIRFHSEKEKLRITSLCESLDLEYTVCPRYIRTGDEAISIEIKRL